MRLLGVVRVAFLVALAAGCASIHNVPLNKPLGAQSGAEIPVGIESPAYTDDLIIGLAFSGGGTRAAAFSFGVLEELARTPLPRRTGAASLIDRLDFVSGVSGGSVTAAYYGLKKRAALADFREKFLLRDAEAGLRTHFGPINIARALAGGVNDSTGLTRWLDENLFHGATFAQFRVERRPRIWINASDIYNRTPFVFGRTAFAAMCSNLAEYPIADAVAASAAVPFVFAPVVIKTYPGRCPLPLPKWVQRARANPTAPPLLKAFAEAVASYHDGAVPYIKLLDGGLVDNFGLSGFTIARLSSPTPYGPLTPAQAVKLRRVLFLVADAGRGPSGNWVRTVEGPRGRKLVEATTDTAIGASVRLSYTAFNQTSDEWRKALVRWRCSLSAAQRRRYGAPRRWNCRDVKFFISYVDFDQLGPARARELNKVPTRFKLQAGQVEALIAAGRDAVRTNAVFRSFLASL